MYKMTIYNEWGDEVKLCRIIKLEAYEEVLAKAKEYAEIYFNKYITLGEVSKVKFTNTYRIFSNHIHIGKLKLLNLNP